MPIRTPLKKWMSFFFGGFIIWLMAIALGLLALKGNMKGLGDQTWLARTGSVYLLWGFLNFLIFFALVHFIIPFCLRTKRYAIMVLVTYLVILAVGVIKYFFAIRPEFIHIMGYYKDENSETLSYFTFGEYILK